MRKAAGPLVLAASVGGEYLHLECGDCQSAASVVDYSVPDGFLVVECMRCGRTGRLKLWQHALWLSTGHGETAKEYRERQAAFYAEYLRTRKPGDPPPAKWPTRKRRVKQ